MLTFGYWTVRHDITQHWVGAILEEEEEEEEELEWDWNLREWEEMGKLKAISAHLQCVATTLITQVGKYL